MEIRIDGKQIDPQVIARQSMNYGQPRGYVRLPFEMRVPRHLAEERLAPVYAQYVAELKADDELVNDPAPVELRDLNYPLLNETLAHHPALFKDMFLIYLQMEFLDLLLLGKASSFDYLVNEIEEVAYDANSITVRGWVLPMSNAENRR